VSYNIEAKTDPQFQDVEVLSKVGNFWQHSTLELAGLISLEPCHGVLDDESIIVFSISFLIN